MSDYQKHSKTALVQSLIGDERIKQGAFTEQFTPEAFVDFVFDNILLALGTKTGSCTLLLEVIQRTLYL